MEVNVKKNTEASATGIKIKKRGRHNLRHRTTFGSTRSAPSFVNIDLLCHSLNILSIFPLSMDSKLAQFYGNAMEHGID